MKNDNNKVEESNGFLPDGYEAPKQSGNYLSKFDEGDTRFRVLSSAITGYMWFVKDKEGKPKPHRVKSFKDVPAEVLKAKDSRDRQKHFWAFVIYNYDAEAIQIMEIKQATLQKGIEALVRNQKWGNPKDYDIVITKTKTGSSEKDVEYNLLPDPKTKTDEGVLRVYRDMELDLNLLYQSRDPFNPEEEIGAVQD